MKLVSTQRGDDIEAQIKSRFAEFNRSSSASKGRKYPAELRALVRQASVKGIDRSILAELTGASSTALTRWCKGAKVRPTRRQQEAVKPRKLEVVGGHIDQRSRPLIVRLPSGVSIELGDGAALDGELLHALLTLGGGHATSR